MTLKQIHLVIHGKVQGVGFRYHTQAMAQKLGLVGWVRNLPEGTVETVAEGPEPQVENFIQWCQRGPSSAEVKLVEVISRKDPKETSHRTFEIRH